MIYWVRKLFTSPEVHGRALREVFWVTLFSLAPLAVMAFSFNAKNGQQSLEFSDVVQQGFGKGQLYLLAYGLYGTLFFLAFMKADRPRHGARATLGALATLVLLPIIGLLGIDPTLSNINNQALIRLSFWIYGYFLVTYYLLLFYCDISPPTPRESMSRETSEMIERYKKLDK